MYTQLQLRDSARPPVNVATLGRMKAEGEKIASYLASDERDEARFIAGEIERRPTLWFCRSVTHEKSLVSEARCVAEKPARR